MSFKSRGVSSFDILLQQIRLKKQNSMGNIALAQQEISDSKQNRSNKLNLSDLGLSSEELTQLIPLIVQELPELKELNLKDNKLQSLPGGIENLTNLKNLYLSHNEITSLPKSIINRPNLCILSVEQNPLSFKSLVAIIRMSSETYVGQLREVIPNNYNDLLSIGDDDKTIKSIIMSVTDSFPDKSFEEYNALFNSLTDNQKFGISELNLSLPEVGIGYDSSNNLSSTLKIQISLSKLVGIAKWIGRRNRGSQLDLSKTNLTSKELELLIPYINEKLPHYIKNLILGGKNLTTLPDNIVGLSNFTSLHISGKVFIKLPENFGKLTNLTELSVINTRITTLPENLGNLQKLKKLDLRGNKGITSLPDSIGNLPDLVELDISNSGVKSLPDSKVKCTILETLNLNGSKLANLDGIQNFIALRYLSAQRIRLTSIDFIKELSNLIKLDIGGNKLTSLGGRNKLPKLEDLNLKRNKLISFNPIVEFTKLKKLDLSGNNITSYKGIHMLPQLENFHLGKNPIFLNELLDFSTIDKIGGLSEKNKRVFNEFKGNNQEEFRDIVTNVLKISPNTSIEDFEIFFLRLSTDQFRGIVEFKLPLCELGIGLDSMNNLSNELDIDLPLFDRFRRADEIREVIGITSIAALSFVENKPEYLQLMLDLGLSEVQLNRVIDFKKERHSIYLQIIKKIQEENYPDENEDIGFGKMSLGEFTKEDKALASTTFDELYKQKPVIMESFLPFYPLSESVSESDNDTSLDMKPAAKGLHANKRQKQASAENSTEKLAQPTATVPAAASLHTELDGSSRENFGMGAMTLTLNTSQSFSLPRSGNDTNSGRKRAAKDLQKMLSASQRQKQAIAKNSTEQLAQPTVGVPAAASLHTELDDNFGMGAMTQTLNASLSIPIQRINHDTNSGRKRAAKDLQRMRNAYKRQKH